MPWREHPRLPPARGMCSTIASSTSRHPSPSSPRSAGHARTARRGGRRARRRCHRSACGRSILFAAGTISRPPSIARYAFASVCASMPWAASTTRSAPSHACRDRDLVGEVHMTGHVDEVELVARQITRTAWALIVIPRSRSSSIESRSCSRITLAHGFAVQLEDAIGERRLAVVDVRDDHEVANAVLLHRSLARRRALRAGIATVATPRAREGRALGQTVRPQRPRTRPPSEKTCATRPRPSSSSRPYHVANEETRRDGPGRRDSSTLTKRRSWKRARGRRAAIITRRTTAATTFTVDVASGMPQIEPVEDGVERGWRRHRARSRSAPVRLHVEAAVEDEHPAVEDEADRERLQALGDDHGVLGELTALVDEADDRLREDDREEPGGNQRERDLPQAAVEHTPKGRRVAPRGEPRERREQDRGHRDGEDPLREHVQPKRLGRWPPGAAPGRAASTRRACRRGSSR